jgi:hypothetical protein
MLMASAGVGLAWVQTQPGLLDRLAPGRIAALRKTAAPRSWPGEIVTLGIPTSFR